MRKVIRYLEKTDADPDKGLPKLCFFVFEQMRKEINKRSEEEIARLYHNRESVVVEHLWQRLLLHVPQPPENWRYHFFLGAALGIHMHLCMGATHHVERAAKNLRALGYKYWPAIPGQKFDPAGAFIRQMALRRFEDESTVPVVTVFMFRHYLKMTFKEMEPLMNQPAKQLQKTFKFIVKRLGELIDEIMSDSPLDQMLAPARARSGLHGQTSI